MLQYQNYCEPPLIGLSLLQMIGGQIISYKIVPFAKNRWSDTVL